MTINGIEIIYFYLIYDRAEFLVVFIKCVGFNRTELNVRLCRLLEVELMRRQRRRKYDWGRRPVRRLGRRNRRPHCWRCGVQVWLGRTGRWKRNCCKRCRDPSWHRRFDRGRSSWSDTCRIRISGIRKANHL
jgi:hypothetical protein